MIVLALIFFGWTETTEAQSAASSHGHELAKLERSLWINASLQAPKRGYWGTAFPESIRPTDPEIVNAVRVLLADACPTRLYLIHHHEMPIAQTKEVLRAWRKACPPSVELVPTLVLKMYDRALTPVFTDEELGELIGFLKKEIHPERIAVYDVLPSRDQGQALTTLAERFPKGLIRVGLQPDEPLNPPFTAAVEDTWSALCHGLTTSDWQDRGFGRDTLRKWVASRNATQAPIAYDLVVVAWDYANTKRGEYPGYDDAHKNLPLPVGRNRLAVTEMLEQAKPGTLAGFSSDLLILQLNSETTQHDGKDESFYETLKAGRHYEGFYAKPWREICEIFNAISKGEIPSSK